MNQDEQNLNLLSTFHYVLGALTILGSCMFFIHVGMGLAIIRGSFDGKNSPPDGFGWIFVIAGSVAIILGWTLGVLMIVAGKKLKEHRSRTFCLVIAGLECTLTPLGTVLGIFTIITLVKEPVIQMFAANDQRAVAPPHSSEL